MTTYYNHQEIEKKWQKKWQNQNLEQADNNSRKPKKYILDMFPYPSGDGLHVGHVESYTATDILSRYYRLNGFNVLHPQGFDAFGLPAENYAISTGIHPAETTKKAIANFKKQINSIGLSYDWSREVITSDPSYYKWTQWLFLQLLKRGLAYKKKAPVNWCQSCKTVLANEQVVNGKCERCESAVIQKDLEQWFFKITDYAEELLEKIDEMDWPEPLKHAQKNWIGKSEGALIKFPIINPRLKRGQVTKNNQLPNSKQIPKSNPQFNWGQNSKYDKILLATNNLSKKARIEKLLKSCGLNITVLLPQDLSLKEIKVPEEGNLFENARDKALAYRQQTDLPILGIDTGFFIKGEKIDPVKTKRNALRGKKEEELNQKEIAQLLLDYYKEIARKNGGEIDAYWKDALVLLLKNGEIKESKAIRKVILTDKIKGEVDHYLPIRALYKDKLTGKHTSELTAKEELKELQPITNALIQLLTEDEEKEGVEVFTTRPDTLFGATYLVLAPEHPQIEDLRLKIKNWDEVEEYIKKAKTKNQLERTDLAKEKTGVELKGIKAINPANQKEIPIWVADYVTMDYGTGAIMAVPGHDERDWEFAKKFNLPIIPVIYGAEMLNLEEAKKLQKGHFRGDLESIIIDYTNRIVNQGAFTDRGYLINSGKFNFKRSDKVFDEIIKFVNGKKQTQYKIRDWLISRQRYWGTPIPIIYCDKCGAVPVPEKDLPILLPTDVDFKPTGESPLVRSKQFHQVKCPKCGQKARRESDTIDTFVCSSWYFLRYCDPQNNKEPFSKESVKKWLPVDLYIGGMEHAVGHLIYARFVTKVLRDLGWLKFDEPFLKIRNQGIILAEDSRKMSKRWGNVINPDEVVEEYGADTLRIYEMFMGPLVDAKPWSQKGIIGVRRFLEKVYNQAEEIYSPETKEKSEDNFKKLNALINKTIKKVTEDIESLKFNTAISSLMIFINESRDLHTIQFSKEQAIFEKFLIILSSFAPHLAEELWESLGHQQSIFKQKWPEYDKKLVVDEEVTIAIQINGKLRETIRVKRGISEKDLKLKIKDLPKIKKHTEGKEIKKFIYIKDKLVNIVIIE